MAGTNFQMLLEAVAQYYGSGSDQWVEIARYGTTADNFLEIVDQLPNYRAIVANNGDIIGYECINAETIANASSVIDSNLPATTVKVSTPATTGTSGGAVVAQKGITSGGLQFITKEVAPAIVATAVGIQAGKTFDSALYNLMPNVWDSWGMSTLNPETWNSITTNDTVSGAMFNMIFGLDPDNNTMQGYVDETAFAYMAMYLQQNQFFTYSSEYVDDKPEMWSDVDLPINNYQEFSYYYDANVIYTYRPFLGASMNVCMNTDVTDNNGYLISASSTPGRVMEFYVNGNHASDYTYTDSYTYDDKTAYYISISSTGLRNKEHTAVDEQNNPDNNTTRGKIAWLMLYGDKVPVGVPGTGITPGAIIPSLNNDMTIPQALNALRTQYPGLWDNAITYPVLQGDGTTTNHTYIPVVTPSADSNTDEKPVSNQNSQLDPKYDPTNDPDGSEWEKISPIIDNTDVPIDEDTGGGDTPPVVIPTGSAKSLFAIYNPSQSEINSFGAWLWSSNFVDQLLKLFNDPMQAIIGLHKIFVSPPVSGVDSIHVGYLDSGVSSNVVGGQYVTVDCGSVSLAEYFGNVFDYEPFTEVNIYLPFIGIERLNVGDVMRSSINVKYHVDVITGACLAEVNVTRDLAGGTLYTYAGNCAVQYPVSSGSYMGIVASVASIAGGVVGTIASGGSLAPLAFGAVNGALNARTRVEHSGGFSGNAGAMGIKKPYLIITRPQTALAQTFPAFNGYPANHSTTIGSCSGFIKCDEVHVENISATSDELSEIETLLKTGIII